MLTFSWTPPPPPPKPIPEWDLWSKQWAIYRSVYANKLTAVPACHSAGKTHLAARLAAAWVLDPDHPIRDTSVVVLAPTHRQITEGIVRHLRLMRNDGIIDGVISAGNSPTWRLDGKNVLIAHSPPRGDSIGVQGLHDRFQLVILDEASGVDSNQWNSVMSLLTPENAVLAIGNPTTPESKFRTACESADSKWNVIRMPISSTPAFTGEKVSANILARLPSKEHVELLRSEWSEAEQMSRLDAVFPSASSLALFRVDDFTFDYDSAPPEKADRIGIDVAGGGADSTVLYAWARDWEGGNGVAWNITPRALRTRDKGALARKLAPVISRWGAPAVFVDGFGDGAELISPLKDLLPGVSALPIMTGRTLKSRRYLNRRARMHWKLKTDPPVLLSPSTTLIEEIRSVQQVVDGAKRQVEKKSRLRDRIGRSPDDLDALLLAYAGVGAGVHLGSGATDTAAREDDEAGVSVAA